METVTPETDGRVRTLGCMEILLSKITDESIVILACCEVTYRIMMFGLHLMKATVSAAENEKLHPECFLLFFAIDSPIRMGV